MANEKVAVSLGKKFSFRIQNAVGSSKVICLIPANFPTLKITQGASPAALAYAYNNTTNITNAGYTCDAVLDDGTIATSITATALTTGFKIREFLQEIKSEGKICKGITVQANNADVFNKSITVIKRTCLTGSAPQYLSLSTYKSVDQTDSTKIVINFDEAGLEMSHDTLMFLEVDDSRTVDITYHF